MLDYRVVQLGTHYRVKSRLPNRESLHMMKLLGSQPWHSKWQGFYRLKKNYMGVSKNRGTPKWMVKIMENPIKMDDLGVPLFLETPI